MLELYKKINEPFTTLCHPWQAMLCFPMENISIACPRIFMATRSSGQEKPLFFLEKQGFSSPRMTRVGIIVNGYKLIIKDRK
jgi:hypothetical protein